MSAVLFRSEYHDPMVWRTALREHIPDLELRVWPDIGDPTDVDVLLTVSPPANWQKEFPRLRLVQAIAAGVDNLLAEEFPPGVTLARISESKQIHGLCDYVVGGVLYFHRDMHVYAGDQTQRRWKPRNPVPTAERTVGVMGLGSFGETCVLRIAQLGFRTRGWSRSKKTIASIETFDGQDGLAAFLHGCEIVVCMLPLTEATRGILSKGLFAQLPSSACLINVGRGGHCIEADLVDALEKGILAGAMIDVMQIEPLPEDSPLWTAPNLLLTPHIGTRADTNAAAALVADNILRLRSNRPLLGVVDRARGY